MGEYEELCETTERQKCRTEHEQQCQEEFSEECQTEYSEQCTEEPREACHTESTQECATEYSEVCGTEFEEACHTEYTEQCKDVPECWEEQQEECHTVQVKVHHEQPEHKKWKRSSGEEGMYGESDVETTGGKKKRSTIALAAAGALGASAIAGAVTGAHLGQKLGFAGGLGVSKAIYLKRNKRSADGEEFALSEGMETINGVETIESGDLAAVRKGRSIGLASAVGLKLGLGAGLAIGLGAKKHAHSAHAKTHKSHGHAHKSHGHAHKAAHHKIAHETVCNHVPVKRCTSSQQCEKVPWEKCENLPVKSCKQVPNTK